MWGSIKRRRKNVNVGILPQPGVELLTVLSKAQSETIFIIDMSWQLQLRWHPNYRKYHQCVSVWWCSPYGLKPLTSKLDLSITPTPTLTKSTIMILMMIITFHLFIGILILYILSFKFENICFYFRPSVLWQCQHTWSTQTKELWCCWWWWFWKLNDDENMIRKSSWYCIIMFWQLHFTMTMTKRWQMWGKRQNIFNMKCDTWWVFVS